MAETKEKAWDIVRLQDVLKEYNELEVEQSKRRSEIFYILKRRVGYKRIQFNSGRLLVNCWGLPDDLDHRRFLKDFDNSIKSITEGAAPPEDEA